MTGNNTEEPAVRAVLDGVYAAWADNDADAFVASYAEDATAVLPGAYLSGKEAVRQTMHAVFAGPLKESTVVREVRQIRFIGDGAAIVNGAGATVLPGQTEPAVDAWVVNTWVLSKHDGSWRVDAYHDCPRDSA